MKIKCSILTTAETQSGKIIESFTQSIEIPLLTDTLEFEGELSVIEPGFVETTVINTIKIDASEQRTTWILATITFFIIFVLMMFFTQSEIEEITQSEKLLQKIQKKYGEWIVEADNLPITKDAKIISTKSFDDLLKISEEIGKPIIHHKTTTANPGVVHTFYVFDEEIHYKHILQQKPSLLHPGLGAESRKVVLGK